MTYLHERHAVIGTGEPGRFDTMADDDTTTDQMRLTAARPRNRLYECECGCSYSTSVELPTSERCPRGHVFTERDWTTRQLVALPPQTEAARPRVEPVSAEVEARQRALIAELRAEVVALQAERVELPFDVMEELHTLLTQHQIPSRTDSIALASDLIGFMARVFRQQHYLDKQRVHALEAERDELLAKLTERRKDIAYHADCRPNRRQAEAALSDAKALNDWRADVTVALRRPGGAHYADVPQHIRDLVIGKEAAEAALTALRDQVTQLCEQWSKDGWLSSIYADTLRQLLPPTDADPGKAQ